MLNAKPYRLLLINSEDDYYFDYYNTPQPRNKRQFAESILLRKRDGLTAARVIKITGGHRVVVDEHIRFGCFRKDSLLGEYV